MAGALAPDGIAAGRGVATATGTAAFPASAGEVLVPAPRARPGALVVTDDRTEHEAEAVRGALDRAGPAHRDLPPYWPDISPIETAWS